MILALYPLSIGTSMNNLLMGQGRSLDISGASGSNQRIAGYLYAAGAVFNALHFAFGPHDMAILKRINEKDKDNQATMADWVRMNRTRGLVADIPSWICYFVGFLFAMS
ncbi:hypothetical protein F5B19DRAFT_46669 [Rostrohypoxylon terebratum]|nr:hypothetical protein F5B19DRAFT_46669 [Rostrohypoxylon terebratum]